MKLSIDKQASGLKIGLALQFILGIYINLFVHFPENADAKANWNFAQHSWIVLLHILIGTILLINATVLLVRVYRLKLNLWKLPAIVGLIGIVIAWLSGEQFVTTQQDGWSFAMALGFVLAVSIYGWGLARNEAKK